MSCTQAGSSATVAGSRRDLGVGAGRRRAGVSGDGGAGVVRDGGEQAVGGGGGEHEQAGDQHRARQRRAGQAALHAQGEQRAADAGGDARRARP